MSFRVLVIILVVAFLVAAGGVGWYLYSQEVATRGELRGSGTIEADELNLGSQIASEVKDILVEEGQTVTKGQTLVRLDDRILKDQVAAAQAGVEAAKASLAAIEDQTSSEADVAEARVRQAESNLAIAKTQLSFTTVTSPITGLIISIPVTEGEAVSPGATIVTVGKITPLKLTVFIDEEDLGKIKIGDKPKVEVDAFPDDQFSGQVSEIATEAEFTPQNVQTREQRTSLVFAVTIDLSDSTGKLKPGMPADAMFEE